MLGQVHPRGAGAVVERDRVDHLPVITPPPTPPRCPVRQQQLDACPLGVCQRHIRTNDQMIGRLLVNCLGAVHALEAVAHAWRTARPATSERDRSKAPGDPPRARTTRLRRGPHPPRQAVPARPDPAQPSDAREPRPSTPDRSLRLRPPRQYMCGQAANGLLRTKIRKRRPRRPLRQVAPTPGRCLQRSETTGAGGLVRTSCGT